LLREWVSFDIQLLISICVNWVLQGHELQNCYHVHLPLPPAPLKIFCPLAINIESWMWWLISKRLLHPFFFILNNQWQPESYCPDRTIHPCCQSFNREPVSTQYC
jgi:hypothetical protein